MDAPKTYTIKPPEWKRSDESEVANERAEMREKLIDAGFTQEPVTKSADEKDFVAEWFGYELWVLETYSGPPSKRCKWTVADASGRVSGFCGGVDEAKNAAELFAGRLIAEHLDEVK